MSLTISSGPAAEPVTLAEAKSHLRVDHSEEDALITSLILAARIQAETHTKLAFVDQTFVYKIDRFPPNGPVDSLLILPRSPLDSVSSVTYLDTAGDSQTLATSVYEVDTASLPGRIRLKFDQVWPNTRTHPEVVTITFIAGYGTLTSVPENIKAAIKLLVANYYEQRAPVVVGTTASEIPLSVERLLSDATVPTFA